MRYIIILLLFVSCQKVKTDQENDSNADNSIAVPHIHSLPINLIKLPDGFKISVYASDVSNARSMSISKNGVLYVGNRSEDKVYALVDENNDYKADKKYIIAEGLHMPNGVALKNGDLYVAERSKIWRFRDIDNHLNTPPEPELIYEQFPEDDHHGWKFIAFGPDGKLYVPVGAPCNVCERLDDQFYASITRMNDDGSDLNIFAHGIRNTVGFSWHPLTGELWFTDNGRDLFGDDKPADELNHAPNEGMHFGYPYCHQGNLLDDEFGAGRSCDDYTAPAQNLGPHVAALGMRFYTGDMFPAEYKNQIFIAEHGSWNRTDKIGYRTSLVRLEGNKAISYETFASGWLKNDGETVWGRPVDVLVMQDGSVLISDDLAGAIYRIFYEPL